MVVKFNRESINSVPKIINENGCWIPYKKPKRSGYVEVTGIDGNKYYLHRLVMCLYYNVEYSDYKIDTRHSQNCDKACFFHEHLLPGTHRQNMVDRVTHGTHYHANLEACPKCGGKFKIVEIKSGINKGTVQRKCTTCRANYLREWRARKREYV